MEPTSVFVESTPWLSYWVPFKMNLLVGLDDGSFVSSSLSYNTVHRWIIPTDIKIGGFRVDQTTVFKHRKAVRGVIEALNDTIITGADGGLYLWNKTNSKKCLRFVSVGSDVWSMIRSTLWDLVCGLGSGTVEIRKLNDLSLIKSFDVHSSSISCLCELEDGTFVSGSHDKTLMRWSLSGTRLQSYKGHTNVVSGVIQLNNEVIVSASHDDRLMMWNVYTGQRIRSLEAHDNFVLGVVKLSKDTFASGSSDQTIRVGRQRRVSRGHKDSGRGGCDDATRRFNSSSSGRSNRDQTVEVSCLTLRYRRDKSDNVYIYRYRTRLVDLCCATIVRNKELYNIQELQHSLPAELFEICFNR